MSNQAISIGRWIIGGILLIASVLQFFGLPGDAPSWVSFVTNHRSLAISVVLMVLGLAVIVNPRRWIERYWRTSKELGAEPPDQTAQEALTAHQSELAQLKDDLDRERSEKWKREDEARTLTQERDALVEKGEGLRREMGSLQEDHLKYLKLAITTGGEVEQLKPFSEWAHGIIDRERVWPLFVSPWQCRISNPSHLDDGEPFFDLDLQIEYRGVLRLVIGEHCSGRLSWPYTFFADEPRITHGQLEKLPFDAVGPTIAYIRFRQYVHGRAEEIKQFLATANEMEFITTDMKVSMRCETFSGEVLHDRNLLGEHLAAKVIR